MGINIKIKKLNKKAILPTRGSNNAAGYDLYNCTDYDATWIPPHTTMMMDTGIAVEIPEGYFGAIFARSGIASRQGLRPANCVGVIDSDYRGQIKIALHNDTDNSQKVVKDERIAQLVIIPYISVDNFLEVNELEETTRGEGGFGSTGK